MKRLFATAGLVAAFAAAPAFAHLAVGAKAPDFSTQGSLAGKPFPFTLSKALKKGPVVLYFFPAAFTPGCTLEAHDFAEAADKYKALHATLIGVTAGNIDQLDKFSVQECRSKFPVAADPDAKIATSYDSLLTQRKGWSDRTSYVIAPAGDIIAVYSSGDHSQHVSQTLDALQKWRTDHPH
jgi:peroxiredoxin Q/BCP